jgi:hypothetical protein
MRPAHSSPELAAASEQGDDVQGIPMQDQTQRKQRWRLTDEQKEMNARFRSWISNPASKIVLERLIAAMVDYELKARLTREP